MSALEGRQISHHRILRRVGSGAMGVVYEAEDLTLGVVDYHSCALGRTTTWTTKNSRDGTSSR